jgi:signal transduction histidine kinase
MRARSVDDRLAPILQAARLEELTTLVVRAAHELSGAAAGFMVLADPTTHDLEPETARDERGRAPRSSLVHQVVVGSSIAARLAHGVTVRSKASTSGEWLVLPLVAESRLQGALAVATPAPADGRAVETLRQLCRRVAPLVTRLREVEELRALTDGLAALVHQGSLCEVRLQAAQDEIRQLRTQDAMRAQLIAGVNHALRTPLVALRGYARLLQQGPDSALSTAQKQQLGVIARNADRLVDVARNLWMPARSTLQLAPFDLRETWLSVLNAAKRRASARGMTLIERTPERPVILVADAARLVQMLASLTEAVITMAPLGQTVRAELRDETARAVISVEVDDAEPSVLADDSATGTGMWLESVREGANRHGGWMTVERGSETGLTLSIVLPRVGAEQ